MTFTGLPAHDRKVKYGNGCCDGISPNFPLLNADIKFSTIQLICQILNRISELDSIFKRTYEDKVSGKLSDNRFWFLADDYEKE